MLIPSKIENSMSSQLLKCLECRLVGAPPKFDLPPPPELTLEQFAELLGTGADRKSFFKQLKCVKAKKGQVFSAINRNSQNNMLSTLSDSTPTATVEKIKLFNSEFYLTQTQSILIFVSCLLIFFTLILVAFIFIYKLFKIRKQLKSCKTVSSVHNCLSSSLSSSSTTSTSDSTAFTNSSKINTIGSSQFVHTNNLCNNTKSSSIVFSEHKENNSNQQGDQKFSHYSYNQQNVNNKSAVSSQIFYNQLFESTRHLAFLPQKETMLKSVQSQNFHYNSSKNLAAINDGQHYLQAVPCQTAHNLIGNYLFYQMQQQQTHNNKHLELSYYDEISNQATGMVNQWDNKSINNVYNQYDVDSNSASKFMLHYPILPVHNPALLNRNSLLVNNDRMHTEQFSYIL